MYRPKVSVTVVTYNAEKYVNYAIQSVLEQTFDDFELIIVDDGSTDRTWEVLQSFKDSRILLLQKEHNYITSLNCAQQLARGEYIARMDADDIMHPQRLSIQIAAMERKKEIDICATWAKCFDNQNKVVASKKGKIISPLKELFQENFICHPSTIIRKSFWDKHNLKYEAEHIYAEDYRLWLLSALKGVTFYIIPQVLHFYRIHNKQVSLLRQQQQAKASVNIRERIIEEKLRIDPKVSLQSLWTSLNRMQEEGIICAQEKCIELGKFLFSDTE